jgi:Protein of unknown function (DUF1559)
MHRHVACLFVLLAGGVLMAAPAPKSPVDNRKDSDVEPVEPVIDLTKVDRNLVLDMRDKANRAKSSNNLKQIGLAIHNYEAANGVVPADIVDKDGTPILSWRVLILPYIEQEPLYNLFKLDEPWNGPNNSKLLEQMPKVYESPRVSVKKKGYTPYLGFSGKNAFFQPGKRQLTLAGIADGCSNTIMIIENSNAAPWTKPVDIAVDPKKDLPDIGKAYGQRPLAVMCDGAVREFNLKKVSAEMLRRAIDPADGNPVQLEK